MSTVTLKVDRMGVDEFEDGLEKEAFSWVMLRKFRVSSRISGGKLGGKVWETKDF